MLTDFDSVAHRIANPLRRATAQKVTPKMSYTALPGLRRKPQYTPRTTEGIRNLSDHRRRELCLIPGMCFETIRRYRNPHAFETEQLKNLFADAMIPAIADPDYERATRIARTADEHAQVLYLSFFDHNWSYAKRAYCLYALACDLTASGFFEIEEGSAIAEALQALCDDVLPQLSPKEIHSAEKQALRLLKHIQDNDYFK